MCNRETNCISWWWNSEKLNELLVGPFLMHMLSNSCKKRERKKELCRTLHNSGGPQAGFFTGMIYRSTPKERSCSREGTWRPWRHWNTNMGCNPNSKLNECAHSHDYHWARGTCRPGGTGGTDLNSLSMKMRCRCGHQQRKPQMRKQARPLAKAQKNAAKQTPKIRPQHWIVTVLSSSLKHFC